MIRRIFGLETEFGLTCVVEGGQRLAAEEVARYLFRKVVAWGRSSNVFLGNGSRLYLDVGSHPEYATAECDDLDQLVAHDKAGELLVRELVIDAHQRMAEDGVPGQIHLFKNNLDSAGNSYGCHENYLVRRRGDFVRLTQVLVPFLITRQILTGAGHILLTPQGPRYTFSQRADHLWEATSSATTRSRPIINTRDEPHADADLYRRLHVICGDSSMSQTTTKLKVGMTDLILRMLESGAIFGDLTLENPVRAIRQISHDLSASQPVALARGASMSAVAMQQRYWEQARQFVSSSAPGPHDEWVLDLWRRGLDALTSGDLTGIDTELDWAIKKRLIDRYRARHRLPLDDPRVRRLDLAYHDVAAPDGLFDRLLQRGLAARVVSDSAIAEAADQPPQTTRAKLRGDFVRAASSHRRDYTVDWVHLKINDHAGRTVLCKDPFSNADERVDALIQMLETGRDGVPGFGP
ncbi:MAG: Pup--protein ligase [Beutenbergiaceae bacterium]